MPALPERHGAASSATDDGFPAWPDEPQIQGSDGVTFAYAIEQAQQERSVPADAWPLEADPLDESDYQPMPPKRSFHFKVRIRNNGRGKPLDYPFDDLDVALKP